jgi:DNA-binding CsgD family transcriptional regulator
MTVSVKGRASFAAKVIALYAGGRSTREVAAELQCSQGKVWRILKNAGIERRSHTEAIILSHKRRGHKVRNTH